MQKTQNQTGGFRQQFDERRGKNGQPIKPRRNPTRQPFRRQLSDAFRH
ncbi:hypothetical protein EVA_07299 [gut metagenome]|uniref:Uncharacterized protein n=1 Tax=gut metagenome TaxID=749906 RepID=J9GBB3_9ZZZZ